MDEIKKKSIGGWSAMTEQLQAMEAENAVLREEVAELREDVSAILTGLRMVYTEISKPSKPTNETVYTPDGLPVCPRHGAPMKKREKQGDTWYSHKVLSQGGEELYCRGYADASSPGWDVGGERPAPSPSPQQAEAAPPAASHYSMRTQTEGVFAFHEACIAENYEQFIGKINSAFPFFNGRAESFTDAIFPGLSGRFDAARSENYAIALETYANFREDHAESKKTAKEIHNTAKARALAAYRGEK